MPAYCIICDDIAPGGLKVPLDTHVCYSGEGKKKVPNRCCGLCWEHWFASQLELGPPDQIHCIWCPQKFELEEMATLGARQGTRILYTLKQEAMNQLTAPEFKCQARCEGPETKAQPFDRAKDGRVFTCVKCKFQTCVDCDRPEHPDETCEEVQSRIRNDPADVAMRESKFQSCPKCNCTGFSEKASCGYRQCVGDGEVGGCGHQYCGHCRIPWVGEGSAYAGGLAAHAPYCKYRKSDRKLDSVHSMPQRWYLSEEQVQAKAEKKEKAKERKAAKEARNTDADEQPAAKKRKTSKKATKT